jgi:WD40 repeat protein
LPSCTIEDHAGRRAAVPRLPCEWASQHDRITVLAFNAAGSLLASAGNDHIVRLWQIDDADSPEPVADHPSVDEHIQLAGHQAAVTAVAFSPCDRRIATASRDSTVKLWQPTTGALVATMLGLPNNGWAMLAADGSYRVDGSPDDRLWWAIKLCRFSAGVLDRHVPAIHVRKVEEQFGLPRSEPPHPPDEKPRRPWWRRPRHPRPRTDPE